MSTTNFPKHGEIWFVSIPNQPNDPHQPRPAIIIISTNGRNKHTSDVVVVPTTSSQSFRPHPDVHIHIPAGEGGLPKASYARCDQISTIDKSLLSGGPLGAPVHLSYRWAMIAAIRRTVGDTTV